MPTHTRSADSTPVKPCKHLAAIRPVEPAGNSCRECVATGRRWDQLWLCLTCGWVSCGATSPARHAADHYSETDHPIAAPLMGPPGVRWCFIDQRWI
jgi:uncharacterized UBP type Zn finger protein